MKIISVVGARPQFIKVPLLSKELRKNHEEFIVHTGQHYDYELSKVFFQELDIPEPRINLEVGSGTHGRMTAEILTRFEDLLIAEKPDLVVVFGDTNSTLAASIAATKLHVKIAHVEAGMRNFDRRKPEEVNRIMVDHISDYLFAATQTAYDNLKREGCHHQQQLFLPGDVTYDLFVRFRDIAEQKSNILQRLELTQGAYMALTIHKQKNTSDLNRLRTIFEALLKLEEKIVFPAHPRTRKYLEEAGIWDRVNNSNIQVIEPLGYLDFIRLVQCSSKMITDSGGVQKDAYVLKVPCVTLVETSWDETVTYGWNKIVDVDQEQIIDAARNFQPTGEHTSFLGDGNAHIKIARTLTELESEIVER